MIGRPVLLINLLAEWYNPFFSISTHSCIEISSRSTRATENQSEITSEEVESICGIIDGCGAVNERMDNLEHPSCLFMLRMIE